MIRYIGLYSRRRRRHENFWDRPSTNGPRPPPPPYAPYHFEGAGAVCLPPHQIGVGGAGPPMSAPACRYREKKILSPHIKSVRDERFNCYRDGDARFNKARNPTPFSMHLNTDLTPWITSLHIIAPSGGLASV